MEAWRGRGLRLARLRRRARPGRSGQGTGRAGPRAARGAAGAVVGRTAPAGGWRGGISAWSRRSPWARRSGSRGRCPPGAPGRAYRSAILWEQTAGRVTSRECWRTLAPGGGISRCCRWPSTRGRCGRRIGARWRAVDAAGRLPARFALAWVVPGLVVLSSIGGKQIHYLIPLLPGFAILASAACLRAGEPARRRDAAPAAGLLAVSGALLLAGDEPAREAEIPRLGEPGLSGLGVVLLIGAPALVLLTGTRRQVIALSLTSPALPDWGSPRRGAAPRSELRPSTARRVPQGGRGGPPAGRARRRLRGAIPFPGTPRAPARGGHRGPAGRMGGGEPVGPGRPPRAVGRRYRGGAPRPAVWSWRGRHRLPNQALAAHCPSAASC